MDTFRSVYPKTSTLCVIASVVILAASCSSGSGASGDDANVAPKTPAAVFEAQSELYGALFEDPPDIDRAATWMSASCRAVSSDSEEVVGTVLDEVELAQSAGISQESVLDIFSEIAYTIEDDIASGDDGSEWVYEEGNWHSTDC